MKIKPLNHCGVEIVDVDIAKLTLADYKEINEITTELLENPEVFFGTVGSWSKFHYIKDAEF